MQYIAYTPQHFLALYMQGKWNG